MNYEEVKKHVEVLLHKLSDDLTYHDAEHTLRDVLSVSVHLAKNIKIEKEDLILLKTAVLFHDLGYLKQYDDNEAIGASMAEEVLPQYGYNHEQVVVIKGLILATKLPQTPSTLLEKIICDADLDSLHRTDFLTQGEKLKHEISIYKNGVNDDEWLNIQLLFLKNHTYFTDVDLELRNKGKLMNISLLESRLGNSVL